MATTQRRVRADHENLAARLGGWSARHRLAAVGVWLVFVIGAMLAGSAVGQQGLTLLDSGVGQSKTAMQMVDDAGLTPPAGEVILIESATYASDSPQFMAVVDKVVVAVRGSGNATSILTPAKSGNRTAHAGLVSFDVVGDPDAAQERVKPIVEAVSKISAPGFTIGQVGAASGNNEANRIAAESFSRAETIALPVTLAILLVVFGALVAAVLPLILALTAFIGATGLLALVSHLIHIDSTANSIMLLVGLAVGIDYCLFYLRRERAERARGASRVDAIAIAAATSGHSVLVSGMIVIVSMSGMLLSGISTFYGIAIATMLVVAVAMVGSVTVLPALLSALGDKVEFGRIPLLHRRRAAGGESRFWRGFDRIHTHPVAVLIVAGCALLALAAPALGMKTAALSIAQQIPNSNRVAAASAEVDRLFPGGAMPAQLVVSAPSITSPEVSKAIASLSAKVKADGVAAGPVSTELHARQNLAQILIPLPGEGNGKVATDALHQLRKVDAPAAFDQLGDVKWAVGGFTAENEDFTSTLNAHLGWVYGFVLALTFGLLLLTFRSAIFAGISVILNLISVGAAYGAMTLVFQHGVGADLIGAWTTGALIPWIPLFVFVILFGLSMDYHIFVVNRVRELYRGGASAQEAIRGGVRATAGVITSAAVIMVAVFAIFATLDMMPFKQIGVGLAVAVALDATVVRLVLLPAGMRLAGDRMWSRADRAAHLAASYTVAG